MLDYVRIINFCIIIIFINIHNAWDQTPAFCMYPLNSLFFLGSCAARHWKMTFLLSIYSDERYIQSYQTALAPRISTLGIFWAIISRKWHYHSAIHPVSSFDALRHSLLLKLVNRLTCISVGLNFEATEKQLIQNEVLHVCTSKYNVIGLVRCRLTGLIASAGGDDCIQIFAEDRSSGDVDQPSFNAVARAETFEGNGLSWNPCVGGLLASCSDDGTVKLWNVTACLSS